MLYEASGDAEAYKVHSILSSFTGVAVIILLCEILNLLASLVPRPIPSFSMFYAEKREGLAWYTSAREVEQW